MVNEVNFPAQNKMKEKWAVEQYSQLKQYCLFLTKDKWDGEDIAQEVMVKAFHQYGHLQNIQPKLLNKIAYHHWIDTLRKRKHETVETLNEKLVGKKEASHVIQMEIVESILKKLTPKQAVALVLKEAFQFQLGEIAEILSTTEMAVKAVLHRAKNRLNKTSVSEEPDNVEISWDEQEPLLALINQSFYSQDPSILINEIPLIRTLASEANRPKLVMFTKHTLSAHPWCGFQMAA